jgi:hypothetical protein
MSHTRHISLLEDLAYRRLLDFYFLHEQPIKHRDAARQIGMRDHEEDVLTILNEFFLSTENGFINVRADKEIAEFRKHQAVSAYGAFIRDNPSLKHLVNKEDYITHYLALSIDVYIGTLRGDDVPIKGTSRGDDAPLTTNHNHNHINTNATVVAFCLPEWIPKETWDAFIQMRKRIGKPATDYAIKLIVAKLERFKNAGQNVKQVLEKSITSSWQDVFEIKGNPYDIGRLTVASSNDPDPALEKIKADEKTTRPPTPEERAILSAFRRKA